MTLQPDSRINKARLLAVMLAVWLCLFLILFLFYLMVRGPHASIADVALGSLLMSAIVTTVCFVGAWVFKRLLSSRVR